MATSTQQPPSCTPAMRVAQMAHGYIISSALGAAVRLNIADVLADNKMHVDVLAEKTGTDKDSLHRLLRLLSSLEIFEQVGNRIYANNEASHSLRSDNSDSQRGFIEFITDAFHFTNYADIVPTIKTGRPATEINTGKNIFELLANDAEEQKRFNDAMTDLSKGAVTAVLDAYDFSGIKLLVDVAGGHGRLLTAILAQYPEMNGAVFDLPQVADGAKNLIKTLGLDGRCQVIAGDFFKELPQADGYLMKHIVHDWNDEHALLILKNCRAAMAQTGVSKLILIEMLLPVNNEPHPSVFLDIEMMVLPGGRERSEEEYRQLLHKAGFKLNKVIACKSPHHVLEAIPQ